MFSLPFQGMFVNGTQNFLCPIRKSRFASYTKGFDISTLSTYNSRQKDNFTSVFNWGSAASG